MALDGIVWYWMVSDGVGWYLHFWESVYFLMNPLINGIDRFPMNGKVDASCRRPGGKLHLRRVPIIGHRQLEAH